MKKTILTCLTLALCFAFFCSFACAVELSEITPYGALKALEFEEQALEDNTEDSWTENNDEYKIEYDSFMSMQMALNSGRIKMMYCPVLVAEYAKKMNPNYCLDDDFGARDAFMLGLLPDREELRDSLNTAISELKEDGTLDALGEKYLDGNFDFVPSEPVEGRETLRVVVTGDYAPIDYVAADGTPCGYNAAFMQAVGDKLGYNIAYVCVDSSQRLMALTTGKADVIFLVMLQYQDNADGSYSVPSSEKSILVTEPYLICADTDVALSQDILDLVDEYFADLE